MVHKQDMPKDGKCLHRLVHRPEQESHEEGQVILSAGCIQKETADAENNNESGPKLPRCRKIPSQETALLTRREDYFEEYTHCDHSSIPMSTVKTINEVLTFDQFSGCCLRGNVFCSRVGRGRKGTTGTGVAGCRRRGGTCSPTIKIIEKPTEFPETKPFSGLIGTPESDRDVRTLDSLVNSVSGGMLTVS